MERYQLRLPFGLTLGSLANELTHAIWKTLGWHAELSHIEASHFSSLEMAVRRILDGYIFAYDSCGNAPVCDQNLRPAEWNMGHPEVFVSGTHSAPVQRLQLEVSSDLGEIVGDMESIILHTLFTKREYIAAAAPVSEEIEGLVKRVLGPFLYLNPECGSATVCSRRKMMSPWRQRVHAV